MTPAARGAPHFRAQIAGGGLITPLGHTLQETWNALLEGQYIHDHSKAAGRWDDRSPRVVQMARQAADQALAEAGWRQGPEIPVIVGTSKGAVDSWLADPTTLQTTFLADIAAALTTGPKITLSGACASGLIALIRGAMMIETGQASRVLVVASEASVHPLFIGSFQRLGVLPKPGVGCRPFDQHRDGFLMSECAAAVCLQATTPQIPQLATASVSVERYALAADASHLTAASPDGHVLKRMLHHLTADLPVDLFHAHGTATELNDTVELAAIEATINQATAAPCLYSHKGALGHSLGAAGLVSVVLSALAHEHSLVPGNVRTLSPIPTQHLQLSSKPTRRPITRSIAIAAGFGGAMAGVTLASALK